MLGTKYKFTVSKRFLRYVKIDTQSDPTATSFPSTEKQKNLSKVLVKELLAMGIKDAKMDKHGYVYATIPATTKKKHVPTICLCSHVDTSPDSSGKGVKPIIHKKYKGGNIKLPDSKVVIKPAVHPELKNQIGNDVITASGKTLLGADDKAGVAEIMDAANFFINNPTIPHGKIRILFTPDEEVGRGVDHVNMKKLGATYGYTMDGSTAGSYQDETFSADGAVITIQGVSAHPGFAKGKMQSAIKIAGDIIHALPKKSLSPETTAKKQGFIHPVSMEAKVESAKIQLILRDFKTSNLTKHAQRLKKIMNTVLKNYPGAHATLTVNEQYRNMKEVISKHPKVSSYVGLALKRAGFKPKKESIRGGTDGSRLSFMGLPCPNIFTGGHAYHSKEEWVSIQDMEKAVETIVHLMMIWEEKSK